MNKLSDLLRDGLESIVVEKETLEPGEPSDPQGNGAQLVCGEVHQSQGGTQAED